MNKNTKTILIIIGVVLVVFGILPLIFGGLSGWNNWGTMGPGMMGSFGWWWLMPIFVIVFWALVIAGIVILIRSITKGIRTDSSPKQSDSPMEILKQRYARGEINKQEFEEKKKDLM